MIEAQCLQPSERLEVDLPVTIEGLKLTVGRGDFRVQGQTYTLPEDQEITFEPAQERISVHGYLAHDSVTNETFVLADIVPEVFGQFDHFEWAESSFQPLHVLFVFTIPPGTSNLDDVPVKVLLRKRQADG